MKYAKCPKCGSDIYDTDYIEETERIYKGDCEYVAQAIKVTCCCCGHRYWVREFFTFSHSEVIDC